MVSVRESQTVIQIAEEFPVVKLEEAVSSHGGHRVYFDFKAQSCQNKEVYQCFSYDEPRIEATKNYVF